MNNCLTASSSCTCEFCSWVWLSLWLCKFAHSFSKNSTLFLRAFISVWRSRITASNLLFAVSTIFSKSATCSLCMHMQNDASKASGEQFGLFCFQALFERRNFVFTCRKFLATSLQLVLQLLQAVVEFVLPENSFLRHFVPWKRRTLLFIWNKTIKKVEVRNEASQEGWKVAWTEEICIPCKQFILQCFFMISQRF